MSGPHPIQRRYHAERLVRRRRADEQQRFAASQRRGRIDPNPHQIDAVIFALRRIPQGGCILADEVGLGKTIEAGLVIAQLLAEGARRVLLIVPKPLLGQWQGELYSLFGIQAREGFDAETFAGDGVFLVGRELAGGARVSAVLREADPFDLCVIDEAHEIFAGIYKRYDRHGEYREDADVASTAHNVRSFLQRGPRPTPVLLLTATPIQNSLVELWGLAQYVERSGTLLGKLPTFRDVFLDGGERKLAPGQAHELRRRISEICQRTLRRQAQEFLKKPFVGRRTRLFEYSMSPEEKSLYDDVTQYLLEDDLCAFSGRQRRLLLLGFHRRMASSLRALAASLERVAERLRGRLRGDEVEPMAANSFWDDLDGADFDLPEEEDDAPVEPTPPPDEKRVRAELERVESFIKRAESLPRDSKARALLDAVRVLGEQTRQGEGSGKVVIFTESLTTQDYLRELLIEDGDVDDADITLFRGKNDGPRAREALLRWQKEVGASLREENRPSPGLAVRLALVHEFKHRSRIFIATEAGAKGLNLQFCDTLINYDLPWNPQRIEQRIGRCHRYSQTRDVTVINFLAKDNEAQHLTFAILSEKLELFGEVLDASDHVLHQPKSESLAGVLDVDFFEKEMQRIYRSARGIEDIEHELRELREKAAERRESFDERMRRTEEIIETRFDENVRRVFTQLESDLKAGLRKLDRDLDRLVTGYLDATEVLYERRVEDGRILIQLLSSRRLPEGFREGDRMVIGPSRDLEDVEPLHLDHPLVHAAVDEARRAAKARFHVRFPLADDAPEELLRRRGRRGRLALVRIRYEGFETVDHLRVVVLFEEEDKPAEENVGEALLGIDAEDVLPLQALQIDDDDLDDAEEEIVFDDQALAAEEEQKRFERMIEQIESYLDDQLLVQRRRRADLAEQAERAQQKRDRALGGEKRDAADADLRRLEGKLEEIDAEIERLAQRRDDEYEKWRGAARERRYAPPQVERLLDVEFVLG